MADASNAAALSPRTGTGGLYWAPAGTALPTDASTALAAAYVELGLVSEDGIADGSDAPSTEDIRAWGGQVVMTLETEAGVKRYVAKLIEIHNADTLEFVYGEGNVTVTPAGAGTPTTIAVSDKGTPPVGGVFVIDSQYKGVLHRRVIPVGSPALTAEDAMVHNAAAGYETTITCQPDATGTRQYIYAELDDAA